jgi:hypothetical protein
MMERGLSKASGWRLNAQWGLFIVIAFRIGLSICQAPSNHTFPILLRRSNLLWLLLFTTNP